MIGQVFKSKNENGLSEMLDETKSADANQPAYDWQDTMEAQISGKNNVLSMYSAYK